MKDNNNKICKMIYEALLQIQKSLNSILYTLKEIEADNDSLIYTDSTDEYPMLDYNPDDYLEHMGLTDKDLYSR